MSATLTPVYILDAVRTPIGKLGGALATVRPDDLAAETLRALLERNPTLDPERLDGICLGNGNGAGEDNRNVGRMAALLAGLPTSVPAATTNRLCGSGMDAVHITSREIAVGDGDLAIAGGVESMSRAPWVVTKPDRAYERLSSTMHSTTLGWRMINERHPDEWTVPLGAGAEILADLHSIDRERQDEFAIRSHRLADEAWCSGRFDQETVCVATISDGPLASVELRRDESVRARATIGDLAKLQPAFRTDGSVTAGNSSPMNDGAAALLLASEAGVSLMGVEPLALIVSRAVSAIDPPLYGLGPVESSERALLRAGIGWSDLDVVELNEAFAAQAIACLDHWPDLDPAIVNPNGGAIAIGHPIGCSGARILTSLAHELRRRGGRYGLATMCIGVGQGIATVIEIV